MPSTTVIIPCGDLRRSDSTAAESPDAYAASDAYHHSRHLYFAAPITTYHTARYARLLAGVRAAFPQVPIIHACAAFASNDDWRARWPAVLRASAAVVFITDEAGYIGSGVWHECHSARAAGVPVWFLADDGALHPDSCLAFHEQEPGNQQRSHRIAVLSARAVRS